jgi:glycerol uptake facilitator-like aquaporin
MFELPTFFASQHVRSGPSQVFSEVVTTFGLITVISNCARWKPEAIPAVVAAYITAAYWFTASTSFANPAVTLARSLTDTFAGIRPADAPAFIAAQFVGAATAAGLHRWMIARYSGWKWSRRSYNYRSRTRSVVGTRHAGRRRPLKVTWAHELL